MIFLFIPVLVFLLDYKVKAYIESNKKEGQSEEALGGMITIRRMSNSGAAGSLLDKKPKAVIGLSGIALFLVGLSYLKEIFKKGNAGIKLCYGLILGGGLSNFYDRIKKGAVTDYFSFNVKWKQFKRLVFNISDMFIIAGSILAIFYNKKERS